MPHTENDEPMSSVVTQTAELHLSTIPRIPGMQMHLCYLRQYRLVRETWRNLARNRYDNYSNHFQPWATSNNINFDPHSVRGKTPVNIAFGEG